MMRHHRLEPASMAGHFETSRHITLSREVVHLVQTSEVACSPLWPTASYGSANSQTCWWIRLWLSWTACTLTSLRIHKPYELPLSTWMTSHKLSIGKGRWLRQRLQQRPDSSLFDWCFKLLKRCAITFTISWCRFTDHFHCLFSSVFGAFLSFSLFGCFYLFCMFLLRTITHA